MNTIKLAATAALLSLGACTAVAISDIGSDKVEVVVDSAKGREDAREAGLPEAERGCALYDKVPDLLSQRRQRNVQNDDLDLRTRWILLYACVAADAGETDS